MERFTRQRHAIRAALQASGRPLLPVEVLDLARTQVPALGLATVYRNLKLLIDSGEVLPVELPGEPPRYECSNHHHHHHFHCHHCNRVFDIYACPGNMQQLVPPGFTVDGHQLTLYGLCGECQPAVAASTTYSAK